MTGIVRRTSRRTQASVHSAGRERAIIIELSPGGDGSPGPTFVGFRLERTRQIYYLPVAFCYQEAMKRKHA